MERIPAPRAYALAYRISSYPGVINQLVLRQAARQQTAAKAAPTTLSAWAAAHPEAMTAAMARQTEGR
jgi:hypothetical protein